MTSLRAAMVATVICITAGFASVSLAGPADQRSFPPSLRELTDSSLVLKIKSQHKCKLKRVCDYFAPATSCSHPPCCKRSHFEKVCEELPKPAPVEEKCQGGMVGKPPNCECPDGTYLVAFVGCVAVIPTAPAPSAPPTGGTKPYCITCGGPGCLQKAPACPSGGLTTCTDVPGKTYYNCCCP